jgi:hypothetical protein
MKKSSRDVEVDPDKSIILRRQCRRVCCQEEMFVEFIQSHAEGLSIIN